SRVRSPGGVPTRRVPRLVPVRDEPWDLALRRPGRAGLRFPLPRDEARARRDRAACAERALRRSSELAHRATAAVGLAFGDLDRATAPDVQRQIANAHTIFNVVLALIFLPVAGLAADVFTRLIPETRRAEGGAIYLNPQVLDTPAVALGQALREVLRMGDVVVQSLRDTLVVFERNDEALMREVIARDDLIDRLEEDIKQYLVKLREHSLTEDQAERETALIFVIVNLEEIGDVIDKNLMELADKKIRGNHVFSA